MCCLDDCTVVVSVPTEVCTVAKPLLMPVIEAAMVVTLVLMIPVSVLIVATLPLIAITVALSAFRLVSMVPVVLFIVVTVALIAASTPAELVTGSANTLNVAFATGLLLPPASYRATTCSPGWNPTL